MKEVIIIGSGGHGAELDDYINYNNNIRGVEEIKIVGYLDDNPDNYSRYQFSAPLIGGVKNHKVRKDIYYIIGIANLKYRQKFVEQYLKDGARFLSLIHASAYISRSCKIGAGAIIGPHVNLGPNTAVGDFSVINSRSSVGHDTHIGKYNFISPNVCFSGFTTVGDSNLFGINSATIPEVQIGNNNKIMAGMIIDRNVGDDTVVFHRFKERVIAIPKT
jgi:sugar O-acyltransferase (sialic acid O-acetyltransferase NeuD family)